MNIDFDKTMAMLNAQPVNNFITNQLSRQDKAQIDNAIEMLFSGLSLKNWLDGGTLGEAWTKALDTVRDFIFSISYNNHAVVYAQEATFRHRTKWKSLIVMSHDATKTIKCPDNQRNDWYAQADAKIQNAVEIIRQKTTMTTPGTKAQSSVAYQNQTSKNMQQILMRENEHEHEYEHEREI